MSINILPTPIASSSVISDLEISFFLGDSYELISRWVMTGLFSSSKSAITLTVIDWTMSSSSSVRGFPGVSIA